MRIDVLCRDGSPLGVTLATLRGEDPTQIGVGGAEYALLTNCETWAERGHHVRLYNEPRPFIPPDTKFEQHPIDRFDPNDDRDVLVIFRSPNPRAITAKGLRVWWSCDQFTIDDFEQFSHQVDRIVTISPAHQTYFKVHYNIQKTEVIDLPVRLEEYNQPIEKVNGRLIWSSVPDRGLDVFHACWPLIARDYPEATLVITSDYRLWGAGAPLNERHRVLWSDHLMTKRVQFKGALSRAELVQEQLKAEVHAYTCTYEELFCIAIAESQVAGAIPVSSACGSLPTTNMGYVLNGDLTKPDWVETFVHKIVDILKNPRKSEMQSQIRTISSARFDPNKIAEKWEALWQG